MVVAYVQTLRVVSMLDETLWSVLPADPPNVLRHPSYTIVYVPVCVGNSHEPAAATYSRGVTLECVSVGQYRYSVCAAAASWLVLLVCLCGLWCCMLQWRARGFVASAASGRPRGASRHATCDVY